jgi:serine/threonine protein kinase
MAAVTQSRDFLTLLVRSRLLGRADIQDYLDHLRGAAVVPAQAGVLAARMVADGLLTRFQARLLLCGKSQRFFLAEKYKVMEELGAGGMGKVFLCEHVRLRRLVAVKLLPPARGADPTAVERFHREARAAAAVDHPNIVRIFDVDQDQHLHFMVMEYVDGVNLQDLLARTGPLPVDAAVHYVTQAAQGLEQVHAAGLVHRDIKPANLLLDRTGVVKILDLGLARFFHDDGDNLTQVTNAHSVLGTAEYIAPEQVLASSAVDIRADLYSLGVTLYTLLSGGSPFGAGTTAEKLMAHHLRPVAPITRLRGDVPAGLGAVLARMMARDPDDRYPTPAAVLEALAPWYTEDVPLPTAAAIPPAGSAGVSATASTPGPRALTPTPGPGRPAPVSGRLQALGSTPSLRLPAGSGSATRPRLSRVPLARPGAAPRRPRARRALGAVLGVLTLAGGLTGGYLAWHAAAGQEARPGPATAALVPPRILDRPFFQVTRDRNMGGDASQGLFRLSIQQALADARPGHVIRVFDAVWEEQLDLTDLKHLRNVTLEGGNPQGRPVLWRVPANADPARPLLRLANVEGLTVRGFVFDGQNQVANLITVAGRCAGLRLDDLDLRDFQKAAVRLEGAAGEVDEPGRFERLRIAAPAVGADAGISFEAAAAGTKAAAANQHLIVQGCSFVGPLETALGLAAPAAYVSITDNRLYRTAAALRYPKAEPPHRLRVSFDHNTCFEVRAVLALAALPPLDETDRITLRHNLFIRTGRILQTDPSADTAQLARLIPQTAGNLCDAESCQQGLVWEGLVRRLADLNPGRFPADPADDGRFLCYPDTALLRSDGADQPSGARAPAAR